MKLAPPIYSLQELATITGVSTRTIRYWVQTGAVPPSTVKGGIGPHWSEDHIRAINRVLKVKQQQMTLADLADRYGYREDRP